MYRAGYPRVTHPSAAWFCSVLNILDLEYSILSKPSLDLHVLGTPPAFILSQDQTLIKKFVTVLRLLLSLKYLAWFVCGLNQVSLSYMV